MKLIFGSRAIKHWFPDFPRRIEDSDIDYIIPTVEKYAHKSSKGIEYHYNITFDELFYINKHPFYLDADLIYTIKVSHAAWDIHWEKTMHDIRFLQSKGCKLNAELYKALLTEWDLVHEKKRINLNKPAEEFFKDAVDRKYSHDELHQKLAFYDKPLYTKITVAEDHAFPLKHKFEAMSFEDQMKCALEEIYVIATERFIIPEQTTPMIAKKKAMKRLITKMTKGWFNLFLIVNYSKLFYNEYDEIHWKPKLKEFK